MKSDELVERWKSPPGSAVGLAKMLVLTACLHACRGGDMNIDLIPTASQTLKPASQRWSFDCPLKPQNRSRSENTIRGHIHADHAVLTTCQSAALFRSGALTSARATLRRACIVHSLCLWSLGAVYSTRHHNELQTPAMNNLSYPAKNQSEMTVQLLT